MVRFERTPGTDRAEYAAVVIDAWQHRRLGVALTGALLAVARARGIAHFDAYVLPENRPMLALFGRLGLPVQTHWAMDQGLRVAIDLTNIPLAESSNGLLSARPGFPFAAAQVPSMRGAGPASGTKPGV